MPLAWVFPPNNDGPEDGLNHPGIETFLGSPLESLAREIIQNSRDASANPGNPVEVHFGFFHLRREWFPGLKEYARMLDACEEYWGENKKTRKFFAKAKRVFEQDTIPFLKISDYNTRGLTGSAGTRNTDWHKLTKAVGASDKEGGQDGSFGIGKHAPFACSSLRTVFYCTKDIDKQTAFQGVAKLVTHLNPRGETTRGEGFYGEKKGLRPVFDLAEVHQLFSRRRFGTDIYVAGFDYGEDWESLIVRSVIENFLVAIHEQQLIVRVGTTRIDSTSLPTLIEAYMQNDTRTVAPCFYQALVGEDKHFYFDDDFQGLGRVELHIAAHAGYPKQVAMVRRSGMVVYPKKHFRTPLKFAGVFIAKGEKINAILKSLEPPSHDYWEPERYDRPSEARALLKAITTWITDHLREISTAVDTEEIDPEGLSQFLPDDIDQAEEKKGDDSRDGGQFTPREVEIETRALRPSSRQPSAGGESGMGSDEGDSATEGDSSNQSNGGWPSTEQGGGEDPGSGATPGDGDSVASRETRINLERVRLYCSDYSTGQYRLSFEPDFDGCGIIRVNIVGEVGEEPAPVKSAEFVATGEAIALGGHGALGPMQFVKGKRQEIVVTLRNHLRCAMEVSAHAS